MSDLPPVVENEDENKSKKSDWCDFGGCDLPGCDHLPSCDLPCCDFGLLSTWMLLVARVSGGRTRGGGGDRAVLGAIRAYRKVSPHLPTSCPYTPSCSAYGLEAVQRYGSRRGLRLTARRLRRCRPGVRRGTADPVP